MMKCFTFIFDVFLFTPAFGVEADQLADLETKAKNRDADARFKLGKKYYYGLGVEQNYKKAARWIRKAARQGHPGAQRYLGEIHEKGLVYRVSYRRAEKWYLTAADQGNTQAQFLLGNIYERGVNEEDVVNFVHYSDYEKGRSRRVLDTGYMNSNLRKGFYLDKDYAEAVKWYQKAALQGHTQAQIKLGVLCANGKGTAQNLDMAYTWFKIASSESEGDLTTQLIETLEVTMTPVQINEADRKAKYWLANYKK